MLFTNKEDWKIEGCRAASPWRALETPANHQQRCCFPALVASSVCCNRPPQTHGLTHTYSHRSGGRKSEIKFSKVSRGDSVPCFLQLLVNPGDPWLVATSLPLWSYCHHYFCLSNLSCVPCRKTFVIKCRADLDNPGYVSLFKTLTLIMFRNIRQYL